MRLARPRDIDQARAALNPATHTSCRVPDFFAMFL